LLDDADVPAKELITVNALFAMQAGVLALDVADGTIAIGFLLLAGEGMEGIGEDVAILIDVDAQGGIEGVGAVIGWAAGVRGLLGGQLGRGCGNGREAESK
jgi:hypothetical protein